MSRPDASAKRVGNCRPIYGIGYVTATREKKSIFLFIQSVTLCRFWLCDCFASFCRCGDRRGKKTSESVLRCRFCFAFSVKSSSNALSVSSITPTNRQVRYNKHINHRLYVFIYLLDLAKRRYRTCLPSVLTASHSSTVAEELVALIRRLHNVESWRSHINDFIAERLNHLAFEMKKNEVKVSVHV